MKKYLKTLVVAASLLTVAATSNAQGTFNFLTFNSDGALGTVSVDTGGNAGSLFSGQIFGGAVGADPSTFVAFGSVASFLDSGGNPTGVINAGQQAAPAGFAGGTQADVVLRAWDTASGSYATALTSGESAVFTVTLGGGGPPPTPDPNMNGFANFTMTTVPEPSVILLGLAGAGMLWFRRKK
jgi:hypothetical protein